MRGSGSVKIAAAVLDMPRRLLAAAESRGADGG